MIEIGSFLLKNWKLIGGLLIVLGLGAALTVTKLRLEHAQNEVDAVTTKLTGAEHDRDIYKSNAAIAQQTANDNAAALETYKNENAKNAKIAADALAQLQGAQDRIKDLQKGVYNAPATDDAVIAPVYLYALNGLRGKAAAASGAASGGKEGTSSH